MLTRFHPCWNKAVAADLSSEGLEARLTRDSLLKLYERVHRHPRSTMRRNTSRSRAAKPDNPNGIRKETDII